MISESFIWILQDWTVIMSIAHSITLYNYIQLYILFKFDIKEYGKFCMLHKNSKREIHNQTRGYFNVDFKKANTKLIMCDICRKQSYCIYWFRISWIIEDRYNFWYQSAYFHLVLITFVQEAARAIFLTSCCYVFSNIDEHAITPIVCLIITV